MGYKKLAVIGKDVSKSVSPQMHSFIAEKMGNSVDYEKISVREDEFDGKIEGLMNDYDGLNVTIPFKISVISRLENIEGDASVFGAVNTVLCGTRTGYNTDGEGFRMMLENNGVEMSGLRVLLLGAGGAGRSVAKKLLDGGAKVCVYDKFRDSSLRLSQEFKGVAPLEKTDAVPYDMIINATGIGMHKTEGESPVGEDLIKLCGVAVDLIYEPKKSRFLEIAESFGKRIINGEAMLFYQAYFSECIYFGRKADGVQAKKFFEEYCKEN